MLFCVKAANKKQCIYGKKFVALNRIESIPFCEYPPTRTREYPALNVRPVRYCVENIFGRKMFRVYFQSGYVHTISS